MQSLVRRGITSFKLNLSTKNPGNTWRIIQLRKIMLMGGLIQINVTVRYYITSCPLLAVA